MIPPWAQKELQSSTFGAEESMVTLMPSLAACRADAAPAMPQPTTRRSVSNAAAGLRSFVLVNAEKRNSKTNDHASAHNKYNR